MAIIYGLKVNLSVAIVAMVNQTAMKSHGNELEQNLNQNKNTETQNEVVKGMFNSLHFIFMTT